jgi:hypothetical protein
MAKEAMFHDYNLFTSKEVRSIWSVTQDLRAGKGKKVSTARFDHVCKILDEKKPDLTYDELVMLANHNGIIEGGI